MASSVDTLCQLCEINNYTDKNIINQLNLRFFLRVVLEIPKDNYLFTSIQPSHQLKACDQCYSNVQQLKVIYSEIIKLSNKFREIQKTIIPTFSTSQNKQVIDSSNSESDNWILKIKETIKTHDYQHFLHPLSVSTEFENLELPSPSQTKKARHTDLINCAIKTELNDNSDESDNDALETPQPEQLSQSDDDLDTFIENNLKEEPISADEEHDPDNLIDPLNSPHDTQPENTVHPTKLDKNPSSRKSPRKKPTQKKSKSARKISTFETRHPTYPKLVRNPFGKYFCPEPNCPKLYSNKVDIELHILSIHLNEATYKCTFPNCTKILSCSKGLKMHLDRHNKTPRYKCTQDPKTCKKMFYSTIELNRHRQHAHSKDFNCKICGKTFACQDYVNIHKLNMHKSKLSFKCDYCGKLFQMKSTLDRHVNLVHEQTKGRWGCEFCDYRFNMKIHLKSHLWRKHSYSMDGYVEEKKVYSEETRCPVKGCREMQSSVESLRNHMRRKHPGLKGEVGEDGLLVQDKETMKFKCKYCDKRYHHQYRLDIHHEAHENKESKPFGCEVCGNRFATGFGLKRHLKRNHDKGSLEEMREKKGGGKGKGGKNSKKD